MYILPLLFWNLQNMEYLHPMDQDFVKMTDLSPTGDFPYAFDRYYPSELPSTDSEITQFYDSWRKRMLDVYRRPNIDKIVEDNDNFKIVINVQQFKPEEISVKVVNRWLVVEAKHEEKKGDHNIISRHFIKKYRLPERADVDQVTSSISKDGILTIIAPLKPEEPKHEREIEIEQSAEDHHDEGEAGTNTDTEKKVEENEIREEMTTQGQEEKEKPEK